MMRTQVRPRHVRDLYVKAWNLQHTKYINAYRSLAYSPVILPSTPAVLKGADDGANGAGLAAGTNLECSVASKQHCNKPIAVAFQTRRMGASVAET